MDFYYKNKDSKNNYELDLFIDIDKINDIDLKNNLFLELKNSIVPEWKIQKLFDDNTFMGDKILAINYKFNNTQPVENISNIDKCTDDSNNFYNFISNGIKNSNLINDYDGEIIFDKEKINILKKLNYFGIIFDMRFDYKYKIKISSNEILFPMCCVGKNRSQYLFYFLKKLQGLTDVEFEVGYPSSGDELSVMINYLDGMLANNSNSNSNSNSNNNSNNKSNKNILSSFFPQYKKDNFSNTIANSLNITNSDGLTQISRSIHVFDKVLKIKQDYLINELKNFETHKYKESKYDIFDELENENIKIKMLYEKYFLLPDNLLQLLNYNTDQDKSNKINKITFVCASDKSFYNLCLCFNALIGKFPNIKLDKIRIVYFGIKDIFQKSNIKQEDIDLFREKLTQGFVF